MTGVRAGEKTVGAGVLANVGRDAAGVIALRTLPYPNPVLRAIWRKLKPARRSSLTRSAGTGRRGRPAATLEIRGIGEIRKRYYTTGLAELRTFRRPVSFLTKPHDG